MPTIEFRIDIGGTDLLPHTFIVIDNGAGDVNTYGFGPADGKSLSGPGIIKDDEIHEYQYTSGTIEVTPEQYNKMVEYVTNSIENPPDYNFWKGFIENNPNQCSQWAIAVAQSGGLNWGWFTWNPYGQAIYIEFNKILDSVRSLFTTASSVAIPVRRDPLILDLDGNGVIKTLGTDAGIHFDHDGNGFKELTGWVAEGDGMLMLDRDADGSLDNGSELFGDFTPLSNGMLAVNGFQALAQFDTNKDGKIDANDTIWSQLKVWQHDPEATDLADPDTSGKMSTLDEIGIKAIYLDSIITNRTDDAGNTETRAGHFEWADGRRNTISEYRLQRNTSNTIPAEFLDVPDDIAALPDLQGYGNVYDLQQAMAREQQAIGNGQEAIGNTLKNLVEQFMTATDTATRNSLMEQILFKWTGSDAIDPNSRGGLIDARKLAVLEKLFGQAFTGTAGTNPHVNAAPLLIQSYNGIFEMFYAQMMTQTHLKPLYEKIAYTWDDATLSVKGDLSAVTTEIQNQLSTDSETGKQLLGEFSRTIRGLGTQEMMNYLSFRETFIDIGNRRWAIGDELGWIIDSGGRNLIAVAGTANDDAISGMEGNGILSGNNGNDTLYGNSGDDALYGGEGNDILNGGEGNDTIWAETGNDILDGGAGNDQLYGGTGNDTYTLRRDSGQDTVIDSDTTAGNTDTIFIGNNLAPEDITLRRSIYNLIIRINNTTDKLTVKDYFRNDSPLNRIEQIRFMDGTTWDINEIYNRVALSTDNDDLIYGGNGDDILKGYGGNDILYGNEGDDTLDGGSGDDTLDGGTGNDTYIFGRGSGRDVIIDTDTAVNTDTILLGADLNAADLNLQRIGDDLKISITGTIDTLTIKNWFLNEGPRYRVENIQFADGTIWDAETIKDNVLLGTEADEILKGYNTPDVIQGFGGSDILYGFQGDDDLDGGTGNDYLDGGAGNDIISGGDGNDTIYSGEGNDTIDGGAGNDILYGAVGNDTYIFGRGSGQDNVWDYDTTTGNIDTILIDSSIQPSEISVRRSGEDFVLSINGTNDKLTVKNWFWNDTSEWKVERIQFADGTVWDVDTIKQRVLQGTEGSDTIIGYNTADFIQGFGGNDTLLGRLGDDTIEGGAGADSLYGESGNDTMDGGADNDILKGGQGDDIFEGGVGSDQLYGDAGSDTMDGGGGNDTLQGGEGNDTYRFGIGSGQDIVIDQDATPSNTDTILLDSGVQPSDATLQRIGDNLILKIADSSQQAATQLTVKNWFSDTGEWQVERIQFADGTMWDVDTIKQFVSQSNTEAESTTIIGTQKDDMLSGGTGDDALFGYGGNDVLDGGMGNDYMYGGNGNDTYRFGIGNGQDIVIDEDITADNVDTILIDSSLQPSEISIQRNLNDLVLSINGTDNRLTVKDWFLNESTTNQIEKIQFADGTVWDLETIKDLVILGTEADETLKGYDTSDVIKGFGGNDYLYGWQGDDTIDGGTGNDKLYGDTGNDILHGEEGDDVLFGHGGNDIMDGGGGDDYLYDETGNDTLRGGEGNDTLYSGDGNDVLDGGAGNDVLYGAKGNDAYSFGRGSGQDSVWDYDTTTGNIDTILLDGSIQPSSISLQRIGNDLILKITDSADWLTVKDWFKNDSSTNQVERIQFADGTVWDVQKIKQMVPSIPPNPGVTIYGTSGNDVLTGGAGDDKIYGMGGNDVFIGGSGNDGLYGANSSGGNVFDGGYGNDYMESVADYSNDTYKFGIGSGQDTIYDYGRWSTDTVEFGPGITKDKLDFVQEGSGLRINIKGTPDSLLIQWWFRDGYLHNACLIEQFKFVDGTVLNQTDIKNIGYKIYGTTGNDSLQGSEAKDYMYGYEGDDILDGTYGDDTLSGGAGNDTLYGGEDPRYSVSGDDVLDGGYGNDYMQGGNGNDTYKFGRGSGQDKIDSYNSWSGYIDIVEFGPGITNDNLDFVREGYNLRINIKGTLDSLLIQGWFGDSRCRVDLKFADGTVLSRYNIKSTEYGIAGNDSLFGTDGNDVLDGGIGNDTMFGNMGSDTYKFGIGSGQDSVVEYGGAGDTIEFLPGIMKQDLEFIREGNNLKLAVKGTTDSLTIQYWFIQNTYKIEQFKFADGTVLTPTDIDAIGYSTTKTGTSGNDTLTGTDAKEIINGGTGSDTLISSTGGDTLIGGAGNDTYQINLGSGTVTINDTATSQESNRIVFGEGIMPDDLSLRTEGNTLIIDIGDGQDSIIFNNFNPEDALGSHAVELFEFVDGQVLTYSELMDKGLGFIGEESEDVMAGTDASDYIAASGGDDIITGGSGNDILDGGSGNDTYVLNVGDGVDTILDIADEGAGNVIQFGEGITVSDIRLTAEDNALVINIGNGQEAIGDRIRLEGFDPNDAANFRSVEEFRFADGTVMNFDELIGLGFTFNGTSGNDTLTGTSTNDTFSGGTGNDTLSGGAGDDTYLYNQGDGIDTISDEALPGQPNTLIFGEGITSSVIKLSHDPDAKTLIINIGNSGEAVHLTNFDASDPYGSHAVEYFQFADGTVLTYSELIDKGFDIIGGSGDDTLSGTATTDRITGNEGSDTLSGGIGIDTLTGGEGDDTYIFNKGDGVDLIDDTATTSAGNTLEFGEGIVLADMRNSLTYRDGKLIIRIGSEGDEVHLTGFNPDDADTGSHAVEAFKFADGTVINYRQLVQNTFILQGDFGDDALTGTNLTDRLYGYEGFDRLEGKGGNDTLTGGIGNDELIGGAGSDTYVFNLGDGVDTIQDVATDAEGNLIVFGEGITRDDLKLTQNGDVLTIQVGSAGDEIRLLNFNPENLNGSLVVQTVEFADGTQVLLKDLLDPGTEGDDIINTGAGNDVIKAKGGNDIVNTNGGNDTIDSGSGDDVINAGAGSDTIMAGEGNDYIDGGIGADIMSGGTGNDTYIVDNTGDIVTENSDEGTDTVQSSVTYTLSANVENLTLTGTASINGTGNVLNNVITGNTGNNILSGLAGNDTLTGNAGNDTLDGGLDADSMAGSAGNDTYVVDNIGDLVTENLNEGTDLVQSSITYTLTNNVENLTLTGTDNINGTGNTLNNVITGNTGNNILDGGTGTDTLIGGQGNDTYIVDNVSDAVIEQEDEGTDMVQSYISYILGNNMENLILTGVAIAGAGNSLDNTLIGNASGNILDGGMGADMMSGGAGDDTYVVDNTGDAVIEKTDEGTDLVQSSISYTLADNVEHLTLTGAASINGTGNDLNNIITGNIAANILNGGLGDDTIDSGSGDDVINAGNGADTVTGGVGNDILNGGSGNDTYIFNIGDGIDTIDDTALTGEGNTILFGEGITASDLRLSYENNSLIIKAGPNGDELKLTGFNPNDALGTHAIETFQFADGTSLIYTDLINKGFDLTGTAGDDIINGTNVVDRITAYEGNDTISSGDGDDVIEGGNGDDVINAGAGSDTIMAGEGNDYIDGGEGADIMTGETGNDTYIVDNAGDIVTENANEGTDLIQSSITYTLANNVENLTLIEDPDQIGTGISDINGTGNILNNIIAGNSGNNILDGGEGADIIIGGAGNDTYYVDNIGDAITENAGEGIDTVNSGITYTLGANLENLTLAGTDNISATGNELNNILTGNTGSNILDGKEGADIMSGRAGNDTYIVDNAGDVVNELANEGIDTVYSGVDYTLSANVENLTLTGTGPDMIGTGNELNNVITGNSTANILNGGMGDDTIIGGSGDDTINSGEGADIITGGVGNDALSGGAGDDTYIYNLGEGLDSINDYAGMDAITMGAGIDFDHTIIRIDNTVAHLRLLDAEGNETTEGVDITVNPDGTIPVETINFADGTGFNTKDLVIEPQTIYGTNKSDVIRTGRSDDTIYAYQGSDIVHAGLSNDIIYGGNGNDTLYGEAGNDILYGENGNDTLSGGNGKDVLYGGNGDDVLTGGKGNDTLYGELGSDTYIFNLGDGQDIISDTGGDSDSVRFNINPLDLIFSRSGNDLVLKIADSSTDQMTVKDWYSGAAYQTEIFQTSDGDRLLNTQVEQLIQAMATFSTDNGMSWSEAIQQKPQEAQAVLAQYWSGDGR